MKIEKLITAFEENRDPERAKGMSAYMRGQFEFFGLSSPARRSITNPFFKEWKVGKEPIDWEFIHALWKIEERECQYAAVDYLIKAKKWLAPDDLAALKQLITTKSWWDTVDLIASHLVGHIVMAYPDCAAIMDEWIDDENLWLKRTAILHQLSYKEKTDQERLFAYCKKRSGDSEFFIAKAIGWALRQYAKTNPDEAQHFVHNTPLQNLSKREALKNL